VPESPHSPPKAAMVEPEEDHTASAKLSIALSPPALSTETVTEAEPQPATKPDVWTKVKLPWFAGCEYRCKICDILYFYNQVTLISAFIHFYFKKLFTVLLIKLDLTNFLFVTYSKLKLNDSGPESSREEESRMSG